MRDMYTAIEASKEIGCSQATVCRWAHALGFNNRFGKSLALTLEEVEAIRENWKKKSGNPNFKKKAC